MKARFRNKSKMLAYLAMSTLVAGSMGCLPNGFYYTYGSQTGLSLLNAVTSNLALSLADAIIPPPETPTN